MTYWGKVVLLFFTGMAVVAPVAVAAMMLGVCPSTVWLAVHVLAFWFGFRVDGCVRWWDAR